MKPAAFQETDGRRLRSHASRERILDAVIAMIDAGGDTPNAEAIALQAGVGLRSVFRHFGDMDTLYAAVMERIGRRYLHLMEPYSAVLWRDQVRESLARRLSLFETGLKYRRIADLVRTGGQTVQIGRRTFDQIMRARLESVVPESVRADLIWFEQLDQWLSLDCYASLRERRDMDHGQAAAVMAAAVEMLIAARTDADAG